ncbi:ElyC/SanA/YdcF family protein [Thalassomonas actiniarum]|uniref:YdcF family protein n=1 Tax=Thalassomonas actiniarum TaxID=485447 RepID=A0AAF0BZY2_9GAMM|nr:ElyC/SanA/YdcF family protein [Thalassomonas actiniarum]WDD96787.1 YdcF family protein [Thalassomonas actiniarum]
MDLFLLKKVLGLLLMPVNLILLFLFFALVFYKLKPGLSFKCLVLGFFTLLLSSLPPVADKVMAPIETQYEAFRQSSKPVDYIVILGCSHSNDDALPAIAQLEYCSLQRLAEAVRIFKLHPEATLVSTGSAVTQGTSNAEKVRQAAISLGVPEHKIINENNARDTEEEAELVAPRVRGKHMVLVTNADHMPRAMAYFKAQGLSPTPAPAAFWVKGDGQNKQWHYYFPHAKTLVQSTRAWYEYLGQLALWFKSLL